MKPPRRIHLDTTASGDPLASLISAVEAGRLVALLKGEGLTRSTVKELLKPESAERLRSILNRQVFTGRETFNAVPGIRPGGLRSGDGKVLVFKAKETYRP
jgi:hypothetical protein